MKSFLLIAASALVAHALSAAEIPTLIRGTPVPAGTWQEIVRITSDGAGCTATIVGPRAIITAAHCADNKATANFTYKGKSYKATMYPSPKYLNNIDHDISLGIVTTDIVDAVPMTIGGVATVQTELTILGYGCTASPGTGGNDGILRIGKSVATGFSAPYDVVSRMPDGAALCYGDSGGPTFLQKDGGYLLLAINSKGNIRDTNYCTRLDVKESTDYLKSMAASNNITICGITGPCGETPPPAEPSCTLTANPGSVKVNGALSLVLTAQNAVSGDIDGTAVNVPNGEKRLTPTTVGSFTSTATVKNSAGKSASCQTSYSVTSDTPPPNRPSCTLTAVPSSARVGESISVELQAAGAVTFASIDANPVDFPVGKLNITRNTKGDYVAVGFVSGSGGSANCEAEYSVVDGVEPPPIAPFAVVPTHCGPNTLPESGVKSACIAVIKRDDSWTQMTQQQVVLVTFIDDTQEVLPILATNTLGSRAGATLASDALKVYGNGLVKKSWVLNTKDAKLTRTQQTFVPTSIEGRSVKGNPKFPSGNAYFIVKNLQPFDVRQHLAKVKVAK